MVLVFLFVIFVVHLQLIDLSVASEDAGFKVVQPNRPSRQSQKNFVEIKENYSQCHFDIEMKWSNDVGSAVYSTPLLIDTLTQGKQIVTASFLQYVEILNGEDGSPLSGWPFVLPNHQFVSSPLSMDINRDGRLEIVVSSKDGQIFFFNTEGQFLRDETLIIPKLPVDKAWFEGVDTDTSSASFLSNSFSGGDEMWDDEYYMQYYYDQEQVEKKKESFQKLESDDEQKVFVDAHILATPLVVDYDRDGLTDIIVPVTYYFDKQKYKHSKKWMEANNVDLTKYVACGIVIFDSASKKPKKVIPLDLTVDRTKYRAFLVSSPTVYDLDGDGDLEIIIGTSVGFLYAISGSGSIVLNILAMEEIHTQPLVSHVSDTEILIFSVDSIGNLVAFNNRGDEVWENHVTGFVAEKMSLADLDQDGELDIVLGTSEGTIEAFRAKDGSRLPNFPVKVGELRAPVSVAQLKNSNKGLHIIAPSVDGNIYIIDTESTCLEKIHVGEKMFAQILADDVSGDGFIDLVAATEDGNILCLKTSSEYHPVKVNTQLHGQGLRVDQITRNQRHVTGSNFYVRFEIFDKEVGKGPYQIEIKIGDFVTLLQESFEKAGHYILSVPCPQYRTYADVRVIMTNSEDQQFVESFTVGFNTYFYRILKWIIAAPFLSMGLFLIFSQKSGTDLPL